MYSINIAQFKAPGKLKHTAQLLSKKSFKHLTLVYPLNIWETNVPD